jgi:MFS family permease
MDIRMQSKIHQIDPSLLAVIAEGFLSRLSFGVVGFALPLYAYHLGMSLSAIGVLISLNVVAEMVLKPLLAPLVDRFGTRRSLGVAVGLRSVVALLLVLAAAPWQLFAIRIMHGVSESLRDPSVNAIIAERGGQRTIASAFAWYNTAKVVAGAVGKSAAGILLTLTVSNYPLVFGCGFLLSALPLYAVVRYVKDAEPDEPVAGTRADAAAIAQPAGMERDAGLSRPAIVQFFGLGALITGSASMVSNLFPLLATKYAGLTEAEAGLVYGASLFVIIFAGPLFGWLYDNVNRQLVLSARSFANIASSLLYIAFPSFGGVATAKIIDDMGKAAFRPAWGAIMAHMSSFDKARRARLMGYMGLAENIGETAGPLLAGFIWNVWGAVALLVLRTVLAVVTEVYGIFVMRSIEQGPIQQGRAAPPIPERKAAEEASAINGVDR